MTHPKKRLKTYPQQVVKKTDFVSKWDDFFVAETLPKSQKFTNSQKWTPGASRDPKGIQKTPKGIQRHPKNIQKASKRHQKAIQKTSKLVKIKSHWNTNSEIPMQRTAKNHAL